MKLFGGLGTGTLEEYREMIDWREASRHDQVLMDKTALVGYFKQDTDMFTCATTLRSKNSVLRII